MESQNKYLKSDNHYSDRHDQMMFRVLKRKEFLSEEKLKKEKDLNRYVIENQKDFIFLIWKYRLWKDRNSLIQKWKNDDMALDELVSSNIPIEGVRCNSCRDIMTVSNHILKENNTKVLFIYDCPKEHFPRKAYYQDGTEHIFPVRRCPECNALLDGNSEEKDNKLLMIDFCTICDYTKTEVLELPEDDKRFTTEERKKYCFINEANIKKAKNFLDDIESFISFGELQLVEDASKELEKEKYKIADIKIVKVPIIEKQLLALVIKLEYIKFQMERPKIARYFTVEFTMQDPTERMEYESVKLLKKEFNKFLLGTNWRLIMDSIDYRLGFLSGRLIAYDSEEDLIKLAKKVGENLTENQKGILEAMYNNPHISAKEVSMIIGISDRKTEANISKLKKLGIIERIGADKGGHWKVIGYFD